MTLPPTFYDRSALRLARALLGQVLCVRAGKTVRRARLVEVEAYVGPHDLAAHSRMGQTPRNAPMFGPPGHAYVFLVYGMHHCFNVTCGKGAAVLVRGAELLEPAAALPGPGRLAKALGLGRDDSGLSLGGDRVWLEAGAVVPPRLVRRGPRIGVDYAGDWALKPFRFWIHGSHGVSLRSGLRPPVRRG